MYTVGGLGAESMKKAYLESTRRGAFGTTSVRIQPMSKVQEAEQPGPSHYQPKENPTQFQTKYPQHTSNFQSMTSRFNELTNGTKVSPLCSRIHNYSYSDIAEVALHYHSNLIFI